MNLLLADDHKLFRQSLSQAIKSIRPDIQILEASNGLEMLSMVTDANIDIILLDIQMPDMNGIEALKELKGRRYKMPVVILTQFDDELLILYLVQLGANSVLSKNCELDELEFALEAVLSTGQYYPKRVLALVQSKLPEFNTSSKLNVTPRELQVLNELKLGFTTKQVADHLGLSVRTIESYRKDMLKRTACKNTLELLNLAFRTGLIN
jgi:DNA-binding NarL/FixJ family response regulator